MYFVHPVLFLSFRLGTLCLRAFAWSPGGSVELLKAGHLEQGTFGSKRYYEKIKEPGFEIEKV